MQLYVGQQQVVRSSGSRRNRRTYVVSLYSVHAVMKDGNTIMIARTTIRDGMFIEQKLERKLGIKNQRVMGEAGGGMGGMGMGMGGMGAQRAMMAGAMMGAAMQQQQLQQQIQMGGMGNSMGGGMGMAHAHGGVHTMATPVMGDARYLANV